MRVSFEIGCYLGFSNGNDTVLHAGPSAHRYIDGGRKVHHPKDRYRETSRESLVHYVPN